MSLNRQSLRHGLGCGGSLCMLGASLLCRREGTPGGSGIAYGSDYDAPKAWRGLPLCKGRLSLHKKSPSASRKGLINSILFHLNYCVQDAGFLPGYGDGMPPVTA